VTGSSGGVSVLVLGLGNPLMADDGFGPAVAASVREAGLPRGAAVVEAPDVLQLGRLWRGEAEVWLVDAVATGDRPGTIHRIAHDELLELAPSVGSAHHLDLVDALRWLLHGSPVLGGVRFRLWGAEPERVGPWAVLGARVAAAVPVVAQEILRAAAGRRLGRADLETSSFGIRTR
jgi:hydrogenase maturation protease